MPGGDGKIFIAGGSADVGHAVRRTGSQATPWLDAIKIAGLEFGEIFRDGFDDTLDTDLIDLFVQAGDFHGAAKAQLITHGRDRDTSLGENRTDGGKLARICHSKAVAFAS